MDYDPEYVAAIEREQQRLIWDAIRRIKKLGQDRERQRAIRALKNKGDVMSHRKRATSQQPRVTYAEHAAKHQKTA